MRLTTITVFLDNTKGALFYKALSLSLKMESSLVSNKNLNLIQIDLSSLGTLNMIN